MLIKLKQFGENSFLKMVWIYFCKFGIALYKSRNYLRRLLHLTIFVCDMKSWQRYLHLQV